MPAEEREKVFQRLYRLDTSRSTPGSGLGLSLVRAIADLHGATIALEDSGPGLAVIVAFQQPINQLCRREGCLGKLTDPYRCGDLAVSLTR
ncbi:sensor histidine kinase [Mesorhizobium sp. 113-3-3]|uniref:sensor histidine kinase n=1 Tax=Mesorhizobium sp. 113-3-3 TaxID=2744516 RepID=UPI001FD080DD|nr:ATP-binding protein [Mesorhizobium sp. 113-3-3]